MNNNYIRPDGRPVDKIRELKVEVGNLDRADGSSKVHLGKNIAVASVYGPREYHPKHSAKADRAAVKVNYRMATFSVDDYKRPFPSRREKEISKVLSEAFESIVLTNFFPRSKIDVHIQIFQSDGGTRTVAAIAASAALADAGIPMRDLTGGIASGIFEEHVCLDLTGHEDMVGTGDMPILYSPVIDEISLFQLDGLFTFEQFKRSLELSINAIKGIVQTIQDALKQKYIAIRDEIGIPDDEETEEIEVEEKLAEEVVKEIVAEEKGVADGMTDSVIAETDMEIEKAPEPIIYPSEATDETTETSKPLESSIESPPITGIDKNEAQHFESTEVPRDDEDAEKPIEQTDDNITSSEPVSASSWYDSESSLTPMMPKDEPKEKRIATFSVEESEEGGEEKNDSNDSSEPSDEESDVIRDLEYSEFEEEE